LQSKRRASYLARNIDRARLASIDSGLRLTASRITLPAVAAGVEGREGEVKAGVSDEITRAAAAAAAAARRAGA